MKTSCNSKGNFSEIKMVKSLLAVLSSSMNDGQISLVSQTSPPPPPPPPRKSLACETRPKFLALVLAVTMYAISMGVTPLVHAHVHRLLTVFRFHMETLN